MNDQTQIPVERSTSGQSRSTVGLGIEYGVRIRYHNKGMSSALYYWQHGCCLALEDRRVRQTADRFTTIELAIAAGEGIRKWLQDHQIEYQVCRLPSWRVARKSMPNAKL